MGNLNRAIQCLEKVDSLSTLYPHCSATVYAKLLRIRIGARENPSEALKQLLALWSVMKDKSQLNRNYIQALLRAEVDLCRLAGKNHFSKALASWLIADSMGEKLYSSLAVLDCYFSENLNAKKFFADRLTQDAKEFGRIKKLLDEVSDSQGETVSTSAEAIKAFL